MYPYPQVEAGPDEIICRGDSVTLEATGQGAVLWQPAPFAQNPNNPRTAVFPPGNTSFVATLTDMNGCVIRDTLMVAVDSANWLSLSPEDTTACAGQPLQLGAFAPPNSTYFWESEGLLDNPRIARPTTMLDSTRMFYITVSDTNNCVASDSLEVVVYHSSAGGDTAICSGTSARLWAEGGASYQWQPAALLDDAGAARPLATIANTTMFTAFVTLPNGCVDTHYVEVRAFPLPELQLSVPDSICEGASSILEIGGAVSYTWSPGIFLDDSTASRVVANVPTTTTFTITAKTGNGCLADTSLELVIRPAPNVDAGPDRKVCGDATTSLQGSGATSYLWSPGFGLDDPTRRNPIVQLLSDQQTYFLLGTDPFGCTGTDSATVRVIDRPRTTIVTELFLCDPESRASLTATGGDRIRWSDGNTNRTRIITPIAGGTVLIATSWIDDCEGIPDTVVINQRDPFPVASFTADPVTGFAPINVQFINQSEKAIRYDWYFGEGLGQSQRDNPVWGYVAGQWRAMLVAYSAENCTDTAWLDLFFENTSIHIPTAFSPNNDNINDFFYLQSYGVEQLSIRIYNRWGREVFASDQPGFRWDGRSADGEDVPRRVCVSGGPDYGERPAGEPDGYDYRAEVKPFFK
ncbi:MAG: gliding motility-associated C-terminal domain-containing protein [Bacteroidia bacterium]